MASKSNPKHRTRPARMGVWLAACATWLVPSVAEARPVLQEPDAAPVQSLAGQQVPGPEPGADLSVSLVTVGAGDPVHEMFGHNAIRIRDRARGTDVSYNWGLFDPGEEGFFWRFLLGDWQYWMAGLSSEPMIAFYMDSGRGVVEQELALTPAQRRMLLDLAELNRRPENAYYRYQYFLDNCSTRVLNILDTVLAGSLREHFTEVPGETFRFHTRRLTEANLLIYVPLDFFMAGRGDRPIAAWYEMFTPMLVRDYLRGTGLIASEVVLDEGVGSDLEEPPRRFAWFALTGLLLAALLAGSAVLASSPRVRVGGRTLPRIGRLGFVLVAGMWSLVMGVAGLVMIVSHFTSHEYMHWNENFLQATPLSLLLAGVLVPAVFLGRGRRLASRVALMAAGVSVLGFVMQVLPGLDQVNGYYMVVAVPAHLALMWGLEEVVRGGERPATA